MRLDRTPVLPFLDDDGVTRPARVLAERDGRVLVMVTRDVGMTHCAWWPAERLLRPAAGVSVSRLGRALVIVG